MNAFLILNLNNEDAENFKNRIDQLVSHTVVTLKRK